jgi:hypothetical protein
MDATAPRVNRPVKLRRQDRQKILRSDRLKSLGDLSTKSVARLPNHWRAPNMGASDPSDLARRDAIRQHPGGTILGHDAHPVPP